MKIIYNKYIPFKGYTAINLFNIVVIRKDKKQVFERAPYLLDKLKRHEYIHTKQGRELLWLLFYISYIVEYLIRKIQYRKAKKANGYKDKKAAYRNISFEREAYTNEYDITYSKKRKLFAFIKYLKEV